MKRCLILIYMLGNILFTAADNTATKEALSVALKSISSQRSPVISPTLILPGRKAGDIDKPDGYLPAGRTG